MEDKNKTKYIDIHSHLNLNQFDSDRGEVITKLQDENIITITVGVDYETSKFAIELAETYEHLYASVGFHPSDSASEIFLYEKYMQLAIHKKVVAVGECGLDYYRLPTDEAEIAKIKAKQKDIFEQQIKIAKFINKPLMIHARPSAGTMDAYNDAIDIIESNPVQGKVMANFHFFVGDLAVASRIVKNGWTMSFDGPITFARDYDEVIKSIPLENIMAETDSPFASPEPYRGQRAEPWMVVEVVKKIAEIKGLSLDQVSKQLLENAKRVFRI